MTAAMSRENQSALSDHYPQKTHLVTLALALATLCLICGLSLPILYTQKMIFWKDTYSVWTGILDLWKLGEYVLAAVLFFFSMVFPFTKLLTLACVWHVKLSDEKRAYLLHWLGLLGKWSMLDVFVVAILIVLVKVGSLAKVEPRIGVYLFGVAIFASMLTTMWVDRLAHHDK